MSSLENRKKELDGALSDALSVEFPFFDLFSLLYTAEYNEYCT